MFDSIKKIKEKIGVTERPYKLKDSDIPIVERANTLHQLIEQKRYDEALKIVESVFDKNSEEDWYNKGNLLYNLDRKEEALECYNQSTNLDTCYVKAWYRKGNILLNFGKYLESAICYEKVIDLEEENNPEGNGWSGVAAFSCMIAYLRECDKFTLAKQSRPYELNKKRLFFENKVRQFLEANEIIPKFDNETKFLDYCWENRNDIRRKLEPSIVTEYRYKSLGFFKFKKDSVKVYDDKNKNEYKIG